MPTHILVECPERIVSAELGVLEPLKPLEQAGRCEVQFLRTADIKREHIVWSDIVVTVRGCEPPSRNIVEQAKKNGRLIIYYLDDDLLNIPRESLAWDYYSDPLITENMKAMLAMSDVLWGVNTNIRDKYLPLTRGAWLQNRVPVRLSVAAVRQTDECDVVKILYAGSTDHSVLVQEILAPVVEAINKDYADRVSFTFIGADSGIHDAKNVRNIPFIKPYEAYRDFVENEGFALAFAPVRVDPFYACKYYNKFVEYASIGAAGIYTDAAPYTQIVVNMENGFLCNNTTQEWYSLTKTLIENPDLIARCQKNARKLLEEEFEPRKVARSIAEQCPHLCSYQAEIIAERDVHLCNAALSFYIGRAGLIWRKDGIRGIPRILYKAARRLAILIAERVKQCVKKVF